MAAVSTRPPPSMPFKRPPNRLEMKSAVLVIDLQVGLFSEIGTPFDFDNVIDRINTITSFARQNGWPVIFVQHERAGSSVEYCSKGWFLVPELVTEASDLRLRKTTPNSFCRTDLERRLKDLGVENLIVCGYATEYCVDSTVRGAAALGFPVQIASDAHTTHDKSHAGAPFIIDHHNRTLSGITSFGVSIAALNTSDIVGTG